MLPIQAILVVDTGDATTVDFETNTDDFNTVDTVQLISNYLQVILLSFVQLIYN